MDRVTDETKRVKKADLKKNAKRKPKKKKSKFKEKHPKLSKALKIGILVFLILIIVTAGILVGAFIGIFGDELKIDEESLVIKHENSTLYDADGNERGTLSGGTKRKSISLSEMSEYLPKAYVAIEDERFYDHSGIDIGRTAYATVTYLLNGGKSKFGGSTITQQVIKNITQDKEKTALAGVIRKVKEISKAIQVEKYLSKDQILELYLNLIFIGGDDVNGVELGSIYYFDKSAKDLSIAECAYLAGINNSPNAYKPFEPYEGEPDKKEKMTEKIKTRTKTVLAKMKEVSYISDDQYNEAIAEVDRGLNFKNGEAAKATIDVTYLEEAAISQILDQIMEENEDMKRDVAEMTLYSGGYKIYTTQKTDIQDVLEEEIKSTNYITKSTYTDTNSETKQKEKITQYSIPTMVIIDHKTGQVVAAATAIGNSEERTTSTKLGYFNYPTSIKKQTGSSMKPISVIAPGLESGIITGATVYDDCPTQWGSWAPKEWYTGYKGLMNMRTAIEVSANIPHAKALTNIGVDNSVAFCQSVGLPDFTNSGLSLALGGLEEGISPFELAGAYAAIANGGEYITPTFYTKVTDKDGNIVYEPKQEKNQVMSKENAYIEANILTQTVIGANGTAKYCAIPGIETAAKTGTTNDDYDRWLSGFSPYYTATCWYGYVHNAEVNYGNGNPAGRIWAAVMKKIHEDLPNANFERPEGIIEKTVCKTSGKLATASCGGNVYKELFSESNVPTESCEGHALVRVCADSGLNATPFCPNVTESAAYLPEKERDALWISQHTIPNIPEGYCTLHQGGGASYVTAEDQAGFQAATEADAMGLTGDARTKYIEDAKARARGQITTTPQAEQSQTPTQQQATPTPAQPQTPSNVQPPQQPQQNENTTPQTNPSVDADAPAGGTPAGEPATNTI